MVEIYTKKHLLILAVTCLLISFSVSYEGLAAIVYATGLFLSFHAGAYYGGHVGLGMATFFGFMNGYPEFNIRGVVLSLIIASPAIGLAVFSITEQSPMAFAFAAGSFIVIFTITQGLVKRFKDEQ